LEVCSSAFGVFEAEFDFRGGDEGVDVGILAGGLVDFFCEVGQEGKAFLVI